MQRLICTYGQIDSQLVAARIVMNSSTAHREHTLFSTAHFVIALKSSVAFGDVTLEQRGPRVAVPPFPGAQ